MTTFKINTSDFLPKTVKDKEGKELELLGIVYDPVEMERWMMGLRLDYPTIVLMVK